MNWNCPCGGSIDLSIFDICLVYLICGGGGNKITVAEDLEGEDCFLSN